MIIRFRHRGRVGFGVLQGGVVHPVEAPGTAPSILEGLEARAGYLESLLASLGEAATSVTAGRWSGPTVPEAETERLAPVFDPGRHMYCIGRNYPEHVREGDQHLRGGASGATAFPVFFSKASGSIVGPGAEIDPNGTEKLDYEGELGVVIGRRCKNVAPEDAHSYVWGYTLVNDVTARDLQSSHVQWFKGKSLDTSGPVGPGIVLADGLPWPPAWQVRLVLNGEVRQDFNTAHMIFDIPAIISGLSAQQTLLPGDLIATGTGSGVGFSRPDGFMRPGDTVRVECEAIGVLENRVGPLRR
jgi:2-keto-4-pentenoate hydratase/2-oxohepta-3-ene-1,7-dioic acid hydratase in catechol pathway